MFVELKTQISGTRNGVDWPPAGTVVDLPEGADLVAAGLAVPADEPDAKAKVEAAVVSEPVETASVDTDVETAVVKPKRRPRA